MKKVRLKSIKKRLKEHDLHIYLYKIYFRENCRKNEFPFEFLNDLFFNDFWNSKII